MKRIFSLILAIAIAFSMAGCSSEDVTSVPREKVEINLPENDTVNGYREPGFVREETNSTNSKAPTSQNVQYCANIKTKIFHLSSCSSAKNMSEENKYLLSNREALINDGYTPCGRCKP